MMPKQQLLFQLISLVVSTLCSVGTQAYQNANFSPTPVARTTNYYLGPISVFVADGADVTTLIPGEPREAEEVTLPDGTEIFEASGVDPNGKSADFKIVIISQEYGWKLDSVTEVLDLDGRPFDLISYLEENGLQSDLKAAEDLIAIGAASCEGNFKREIRRAEERAMTLVAWLRQVRPTANHSRDLHTLNLGRHNEACKTENTDATIHQRLVTIVWVPKKENGVLLKEALHDAMTKLGARGKLRLNPADYSVFRLNNAT